MRSVCPPGVFCMSSGLIAGISLAAVAVIAVVVSIPSLFEKPRQQDVGHTIAPPAVIQEIVHMQPAPTEVVVAPFPGGFVPPPPERDVGIMARPALTMALPAMATSGLPSPFQQVGVMRKEDDDPSHDDIMAPLFGRLLQSNRSRWNYYTIAPGAGTLPVRIRNRECMDHTSGCDELYDGDTVTVDGLKNGVYKVMMYKASMPQYDPRVF